MNTRAFHKKTIHKLMLIGCTIAFVIISLPFFSVVPKDICEFKLDSMDDKIQISWDAPLPSSIDRFELFITNGDDFSKSIYLSPFCRKHIFQDGKHGEIYQVFLKARYKDGSYGEEYAGEAFFLDFNKLPDIPIISINTVDGIDPTYDDAIKEDVSFPGETITNNEYVTGNLLFIQNGQSNFSSKVKIRIRGNTSSALNEKKSYKIVLDDPMDLLELGSEYADREWILLNSSYNLNTYIGEYLAELCGAEWAPRMRFVNVTINNDWKGHYILIESVKRSTMRCNIASTGYLFESDAYWWNSDGKYFTTEHSMPIGFTFKYPQIENGEEENVVLLSHYMEEFENYLYTGDERFWEYIDIDSFVTWIMVRDLLGDIDILGSNRYYYKYDFDPLNPTASKLKMGPLWDFDASFSDAENYSLQHSVPSEGLYFSELFKYELFNNAYHAKWDEIKDKVVPEIEKLLTDLYNEQGKALNESRILEGARYHRQYSSIEDEISKRLGYFKVHTEWMNRMICGGDE